MFKKSIPLFLLLIVSVSSLCAAPTIKNVPLLVSPANWEDMGDLRNEGDGRVSILVDFEDGMSLQEADDFGEDFSLDFDSVASNTDGIALYRATVPFTKLGKVLKKLRQHKDKVEHAEADILYWAQNFPNDPLYKHQWHLDQIKMPQAWKMADGEGIIVAVIDTGVGCEDYNEFKKAEDLKGTRFVPGYNFVHNNTHPIDDNGHGTHVAGTIAQTTNNGVGCAGVGLKVAIMPLKVLSGAGFGSAGAIAAAIKWAADNGAHVINMSLGSRLPSYSIKKACEYAHKKGVVIVCAAGNSGRRGVGYPAKFKCCIGVSATRYDEQITFYSSWGDGVDLAAPGGDVRVDQNGDGVPDGVMQNTFMRGDPEQEGYYNFMGTSMASPHVAGVAALVVAQGVKDPEKVRSILKKSARTKGSGKNDEKYGAGIVDTVAAINMARDGSGGGDDDDDKDDSDDGLALLIILLLLLLAYLLIKLIRKLYPRPDLMWALGLTLGLSGLLVDFCGLAITALPLASFLLLSGVVTWRSFLAGLSFGIAASLFTLFSAKGLVFTGICGTLAFLSGLAIEIRRAADA